MGAGKTSVADLLSRRLEITKIEMDDLVLKKSGERSINDIFNRFGETYFRELEIKIAKTLSKKRNTVISTGGGVVMNKINLDYLKKNGKTVFLKASFRTIEKRLKNDVCRPLFEDKGKAKKLFLFRRSLYNEYADLVINTDNQSVEEVVNKLIANL